MIRRYELILAGFVAIVISMIGERAALANEPAKAQSKPPRVPAGLATIVQSVLDTVLEHHIDPPARQQMILTGVKALYRTAVRSGARRIKPPRLDRDHI